MCAVFFNGFWCVSDHSKGFGGKFGVQEDRKDKSAVGWEHHENLQKHESQTGTFVWVDYVHTVHCIYSVIKCFKVL
jgi:hypothetical protein